MGGVAGHTVRVHRPAPHADSPVHEVRPSHAFQTVACVNTTETATVTGYAGQTVAPLKVVLDQTQLADGGVGAGSAAGKSSYAGLAQVGGGVEVELVGTGQTGGGVGAFAAA